MNGLSTDEARAKLQRPRLAEHGCGSFVLAHPIRLRELLSHLAARSDPAYERYLSATVALKTHATEVDGHGTALLPKIEPRLHLNHPVTKQNPIAEMGIPLTVIEFNYRL